MMHRNLLKSTIIMLHVLKKIFINRGEEYNTIKIEDKKILIFFSSEHRAYLDWQEIFGLKFILTFTKKHLLDTHLGRTCSGSR